MQATLHFVGDIADKSDPAGDIHALARRFHIEPHVFVTGSYLPEERYRDYLIAADAAVQLRTYGFGSVSGTLMDCATVGLPAVANESLAAAIDVPASYIMTVPDDLNSSAVASALFALLTASADPTAVALRLEQCIAFNRTRTPAAYAERLCEILDLETASGSA
jgi:hypothetical protein